MLTLLPLFLLLLLLASLSLVIPLSPSPSPSPYFYSYSYHYSHPYPYSYLYIPTPPPVSTPTSTPIHPPQIKKLVYVYLVRYAEEQQDLALLSISTFQKGLKDPNQLIRASALRVLSSIRVPIIAPIMMLAIKEVCLHIHVLIMGYFVTFSLSLSPSLSSPFSFFLSWQSVTDMSPFVRKTAAHAIPKLFR